MRVKLSGLCGVEDLPARGAAVRSGKGVTGLLASRIADRASWEGVEGLR